MKIDLNLERNLWYLAKFLLAFVVVHFILKFW